MPSLVVDRAFFAGHPEHASRLWRGAATRLFWAQQRLTGTEIGVRDWARIPLRPALLATNSSQRHDFLAVRSALERVGIQAATLVKAKMYHSPIARFLLPRFGGIPLISKGYLLTLDFRAVHERFPTEDEYRALRTHLEDGAPLPAATVFQELEVRPRLVAGFVIEAGGYRAGVISAYQSLMEETLRLCRQAMAAGHHIHLYPEGTVSSRLAQLRPGVVQLARALKVPVVPIGLSGCREAFRGSGFGLRGGRIVIRVGEPLELDPPQLPRSFRPFDPEDERRYGPVLREQVARLGDRLQDLLDPAYRRLDDRPGDGVQGVRRFL